MKEGKECIEYKDNEDNLRVILEANCMMENNS